MAYVDGTAFGQMSGGTIMVSSRLVTIDANDVVVVHAGCETSSGSAPSISTVVANPDAGYSAITFTLRKTFQNTNVQSQEEWYAIAAVPFSGTITVTYAAAVDDAAISVIAVSGCNTVTPWDANASLPATGATAVNQTISTTSTNTFVLSFLGTDTNLTVGPPTPAANGLIQEVANDGGTNHEYIYVAGGNALVAQSGVIWGFTGTATSKFILVDALVANAPPSPPSATPAHGQMYQRPFNQPAWTTAMQAATLQPYTYAEIWSAMNPYNALNAPTQKRLLGGLLVTSGSVSIDRANNIRRNATNVTMLLDAGGQLLPVANTSSGDFSPYGNELRLFKGIKNGSLVPTFATVTGSALTLPLTITVGSNDQFVYTPFGGSPTTFTIFAGTYATMITLANAVAAAESLSGFNLFNFCNVLVSGTSLEIQSRIMGINQNGDTLTPGTHNALGTLGFGSLATLAGGTGTMAALGRFLIEDVDVKNDANGVTLVSTMGDTAQWITRRGFREAYSTNGVDTADVVINSILQEVIKSSFFYPFPTVFTTTTYIPAIGHFNIGDDPWKACCDFAAVAGMQLYFDYNGWLILEPIPDQSSTSACISYLEGTSSAMTTLDRTLSNKAVPNIICLVAQGSNVNRPMQVFWWDSDSSRETYYAPAPVGGFIPTNPQTSLPLQDAAATYPALLQTITTSLASSLPQLAALALATGLTAIGTMETSQFTIRDNPAHDVDDVINYARVVAGIPNPTKYVKDQIQIDLGPSSPLQLAGRLIT